MANHLGSEGVVKIGANTLAELRSWEITETSDTIEDTTLSDTYRTYAAGLKAWSGRATAFWDETDTNGQMVLTAGASVTLNVYPEGATPTTSETYYTGTALVTSVQLSAQTNGMVEAQFNFTGTGTLSRSTLA